MEFRFDAGRHEYLDITTGEVLPHITGMLKQAGLVDDRWFTEASRERGSGVHRLTADYDLGGIEHEDLPKVDSPYKAWLLAHVKWTQMVRPSWQIVEMPYVHPTFRYGGRPDRGGTLYHSLSLVEIKSGAREDIPHGVQLALQAMLVADEFHLTPETIRRYALYLQGNGRFVFEEFTNRTRDFGIARDVIRQCCRPQEPLCLPNPPKARRPASAGKPRSSGRQPRRL